MKLLVVTQVIDTEDIYLGFFHRWIEALALRIERIEAVCLKEGKHALPENVRVHTLGKENGRQHSVVYAFRFLCIAWKLRNDYDTVLVHMNQEYVLIAGLMWRLMGKRVYMWRNHYAGSFVTDIAVRFCTRVFCTSKHSYTAKYKNNVFMPVGVDTERFSPRPVPRAQNSILFFARMMESKRPGLVIDALIILAKRGVAFSASFVGSTPPGEEWYVTALKQRVADAKLSERVTFLPGVPNEKAPEVYSSHVVFVNAGRSGMYDKMIFEAAASGCVVIAASDDWRELAGDDFWFDGSAESLADKLEAALSSGSVPDIRTDLARTQSLATLATRLVEEVH